ncbi:MAG: FAD-binding protein, partial [Actinobacteria bacterium]|nr:FAD-binding protein [Actinomycetota bacterium]
GLMLHRFLTSEVAKQPRIVHYPNRQLIELIVSDGQVRGVTVRSGGEELPMLADAVILATGGYCGVYSRSTGAPQATGCGILVAARAGAIVSDMEFVQFHPTVLAGTRNLITEAVRGAGGVLRDDSGRRFMFDFDERGELAPRDVVSNGVFHTLASTGGSVWLDATG